ncbi:hypothetical protein ACET3Z_015520 [Daucus carota]
MKSDGYILMLNLVMMVVLVKKSEGVWLSLHAVGSKCVSEEIHGNVVCLGDYMVEDPQGSHPTISVRVTSPYGTTIHSRENVTHGQFAFTTSEAGLYLTCFWTNHPGELSVNLDWRIGIAAKDWDLIAKREKIEGVELELRKLEAAVEAIHENIFDLKRRESEMRIVNEVTNSRVAWYSFMSLSVCIVVSALQITHLKRFFQKKKLI